MKGKKVRKAGKFVGIQAAYPSGPEAQRAIAATALSDKNGIEIRISAFNSPAQSAKLNACLPTGETGNTVKFQKNLL